MLKSRFLRSCLATSAFAWTILLALPTATPAGPLPAADSRPAMSPTPMLYPAEMAACPRCCPGPCMCVPNARYWGHFPRQWAPWPGDERRADIRFPEGQGIEKIRAPEGQPPKDIPREEYAPAETDLGPGVRLQERPPSGPIPTTPLPFQDFGLPGLDFPPPSATPEPPPAETTPQTDQPTIPTLPGMDSTYVIPPAPMPSQSGWMPSTPGPLPNVVASPTPAPNAATHEPPAERPPLSVAPLSVASRPESFDIAPLPVVLPPGGVLPATLVGQPQDSAIVDDPVSEPLNAPMPPVPFAATGGMPMPVPTAPHEGQFAPNKRCETPSESAPPAPMPNSFVPGQKQPSPAADSPQSVQPDAGPGEWKSRRANVERMGTTPAEFLKPVEVVPVGLDGYCPVELVRHEEWIDGKPQFAVEHEGRTYLMSGPQQQRLFRANPERYSPVLAGRDLVLAVNSGDLVPGRTEMCAIYDGRLFMFSSKATLDAFNESPELFLAELEQPAK